MFIGHFALAFAAKPAAPRVSLPVLFAAAQLADLAWPLFLAVGLEQVRIDPGNTAFTPLDFVSYPYSHSLALLIVWGVAMAAVYRVAAHHNGRASVVVALLVVSHWFLDFATHRPDMPLYPGGPKGGLGLWRSVPATITLELAMYAFGLWLYVRSTRARDATGRWAFVGLAAFLALAYTGNIVGGPPPSVGAVEIVGAIGGFVILVWSWWVERHRQAA